MKALVKWQKGMDFRGKAESDIWVPIGPSKPESGPPQAATPMELLLIALGACTAMDVVHILGKKRIAFDDFWVELDADKNDTHPIIYKQIKMKFIIVGNVPKDAFEQAVTLSAEKYCSVGAMVSKVAEITRETEVREK